MKRKALFAPFFLGFCAVLGSAAQTQAFPLAVSLSSERGLSVVGQTCPTFNWTAVDWALDSRVALSQAFETEAPGYEDIADGVLPMLSKEIAGQAKFKLKVIVSAANIRVKPDITSPVIKTVPLATILESEAKEGSWYKVNLPQDSKGIVITGYIHESIVQVIEEVKAEIKEIPKVEPPVKAEVAKKEAPPKGQEPPVQRSSSLESPPIKGGFLFNPLGFLQFGPILEIEISMGSNIFLAPHVRYSALGLAYYAIESSGFEDSVSMGSMAIGLGIKYFATNPTSPNRFYFGGYGEYGWGGTAGDLQTSSEWQGNDSYFDVLLNFGYRWRFSSKFFLNLGLFGGGAMKLTDKWWYISNPATIFENNKAFYILGMLELSLGWEW